MKKSIVTIASAAVLTAMLCLAGCSGSSSSSAVSASGSSASASSASASASSSAQDQAKAEYDRASALFAEGKYYSAKEAFENSSYGDWKERAEACVQPMPETGEIWHDENMTSDQMRLDFDVNETNENVGRYIAVYTEDKELVETVFVKGTGTVETWLPGGNYYVKDASGTEWYGETELFGRDGEYETMVFDEVDGDRYLTVLEEGYAWAITINTATGEGQGVGSEQNEWGSW